MGGFFDLLLHGVDIQRLARRPSEDTKSRVVYTHLFLGETQEIVARFFGVHQTSVTRRVGKYFELLNNDPHNNDPTATDIYTGNLRRVIAVFIFTTLQKDPLLDLREIRSLVYHSFNLTVSSSTLLVGNRFSCNKARWTMIFSFGLNRIKRYIGVTFTQELVFIDEITFRPEHYDRTHGESKYTMCFSIKVKGRAAQFGRCN
ncbi:hypothetical protein P9112_001090 [Eukaryota sp. TZLM1-RC]